MENFLSVLENKEIKSIINENEVDIINEQIATLTFSNDVEELEEQIKQLRVYYKNIQEKRKDFFKNLKDDEKKIMTIEKSLEAKGIEAKAKLEELKREENEKFISMTLEAFKTYFDIKAVNLFIFNDFAHFKAFNKLDDKELLKGKWTTDKQALAKPGKDLVDEYVNKFQNDKLVIVQGTEDEQKLKFEFYKSSDFNIQDMLVKFEEYKEMEAKRIADAERIAEERLQEKLENEAYQKKMQERAEAKANEKIEKQTQEKKEQEEQQAQDIEEVKEVTKNDIDIVEVVEVIEPQIEIIDAREDEDIIEKTYKFKGSKAEVRKALEFANSLNIQIEKVGN